MIHPRPRHLLVIGAQRSGSTYLSEALDAHPQITMARPALPEPKVFCDADKAARGLDWYHHTLFGHAGQEPLLGDKSTSYLEDPKAPARAADMLGEAHVVAVLRDPVQRAVSNWRFSTKHGLETRPLEQALLADLEAEQPWDRTATSVSPFAYVRRGRYLDYLEPWVATFPDTTHVLFLEELLDRPGRPQWPVPRPRCRPRGGAGSTQWTGQQQPGQPTPVERLLWWAHWRRTTRRARQPWVPTSAGRCRGDRGRGKGPAGGAPGDPVQRRRGRGP